MELTKKNDQVFVIKATTSGVVFGLILIGLSIVAWMVVRRFEGTIIYVEPAIIALLGVLFIMLNRQQQLTINLQDQTITLYGRWLRLLPLKKQQELSVDQISSITYDYGWGRGGIFCSLVLGNDQLKLSSKVHYTGGINGRLHGLMREQVIASRVAKYMNVPLAISKNGIPQDQATLQRPTGRLRPAAAIGLLCSLVMSIFGLIVLVHIPSQAPFGSLSAGEQTGVVAFWFGLVTGLVSLFAYFIAPMQVSLNAE